MARRTFTMVDVTEILQHWYAGRPKVEVARSLGVDAKTVRRYVAAAEAAGMAPGGPPVPEEQWRALARQWFPQLAGTGIRQVSWREIAVHHDRIAGLLPVVPVSVIHQRLADEQGLEASVASVRRYVRAHFPGEARAGQVRPPRPPVPPGAEAQVDYGYLGLWPDPATGRRRRVWAFSMVLPYSRYLFVRPVVSMTQRAWTEAHVAAFEFFGGAPRKLTPDNLKAGVCKPDLYDPKINRGYAELARHYGCLVDPARAYPPRDKPRVAYCTSSERSAARSRSCRSLGVVPASLVEGRRVGPGRVVEDFAFVVIPLPGDNSGVVPVFDGCGGHAEQPGHLAERDQAGVGQPLAAAA
jgi:transposase